MFEQWLQIVYCLLDSSFRPHRGRKLVSVQPEPLRNRFGYDWFRRFRFRADTVAMETVREKNRRTLNYHLIKKIKKNLNFDILL